MAGGKSGQETSGRKRATKSAFPVNIRSTKEWLSRWKASCRTGTSSSTRRRTGAVSSDNGIPLNRGGPIQDKVVLEVGVQRAEVN